MSTHQPVTPEHAADRPQRSDPAPVRDRTPVSPSKVHAARRRALTEAILRARAA